LPDGDRKYREKNHHLAGAGYITKLGCQIKQTNLVFDNTLLNTVHWMTLLRFHVWLIKIRTLIKPGNPTLWQDLDALDSIMMAPVS